MDFNSDFVGSALGDLEKQFQEEQRMDYNSDFVDFALEDLEKQFQGEERRFQDVDKQLMGQNHHKLSVFRPPSTRQQSVFVTLISVRMRMWNFREAFKILVLFRDCTHRWSNAEDVVQNLASLVIRIEAAIEEIARQLEGAEKASKSKILFQNTSEKDKLEVAAREKKCLEEWASKLIDLFSKWKVRIELFKPEIRAVYDSLSCHSIQTYPPLHDHYQWEKFVQSIELNLKLLQIAAYYRLYSYSLQEEIKSFAEKLTSVRVFIGQLADSFPENPEIEDVMVLVGSVAINAALLCCECWVRQMDPNKEGDISNMLLDSQMKIDLPLLDLQQNMDLSASNSTSTSVILPKSFRPITDSRTVSQVDMFVKYLFGSTKLVARHRELMSLITSVINIPENYTNDAQGHLVDLKLMLKLVRILHYSLTRGCVSSLMHLNFAAKIWLTKIKIFLMKQLISGDTSLQYMEEQINVCDQGERNLDLEEGLRYLRTFCTDPAEENTEYVNRIFTLMEEVGRIVASVNLSLYAKGITRKMLRDVLLKLLVKTLLFKAELSLMQLVNHNESLMILVKDQIVSLHEGLKLLKEFVRNLPEGNLENGKFTFTHIEELARGLISIYFSFPTNKITEEMGRQTDLLLSDFRDEIKIIMVELKEFSFHVLRFNYPKNGGLGFLDAFLRNLRELLNYKAHLVAAMKPQIEEICQGLEFLRPLLRDILEQDVEVQELKDLGSCVVEVAYQAEYLMDSILVGNSTEQQNTLWLCHLLEDIRLLKVQLPEVYEKKINGLRIQNVAQTSRNIMSTNRTPRNEEMVVGLNDQEEVIIDRLTRGSLQQDIVSIVGMPGIGKTTLAKKVYNNPKVTYYFHIRAWCYVSQVYTKRELLLDILSPIIGLTGYILGMTDEDLNLKLYQCLKKKRYLIVLDDMWNSGAWEDLRTSFPNDENGSRILVTSRLHDVALKVKPDSDPHPIRLLSDDESWDLLEMKMFHEEDCPRELLEVGRKIARNCKGLPLAIVAIAGLLQRTNRTQGWWEQIAANLSSRVVDDPQTRCMDILGLSYKHLPNYLKPCFLYFGAFLGDKDIPTWKLILLWISEGFIEKIGPKSLEDVAEDYLMDLISRSLVIVAKPSSRGGVKACRVHDILRDLCLAKAKEENFIQLTPSYQDPHASFDGLDYGIDFDYSYPSVTYEDRRLCIYSKRKHFVMSKPSGPCVRSLLFFATSDSYPRCPYDISFISDNFNLLKVLDLECINMGFCFPSGVETLILLRYLAVSGDIDSVPSSIANLWNLETFYVKGLKGKVMIPDTVWCMTRLRHLHINNHAVFSLPEDKPANFPKLDDLVTLSSPFLPYGEYTERIVRSLPSLRKLKCIFSESQDFSRNCNRFPRLDSLTQLEALKIVYYGRALNPVEFTFPLNLKKLTLSNFRLPWDSISSIGRLQNLEVLKLLSRAFEGQRWDMTEGEFSKLKFLKLDTLDIAQWNASNDNLPNLQHLVLLHCKHLEEVPSSFVDIPTLQRIEVQWCGQSCEESVRKMQEEEIEGLKVIINLSGSEFRSSS